jgi:hypothetical protein
MRSRVCAGRQPSEASLGVLAEDSSGRLHAHGVAHCFEPWRAGACAQRPADRSIARGRIRQTTGRKRSTLPQEGEPTPPQASPESVERGLALATIRPRRASHDGGELSKGSGAARELIRRLVDLGIVPRRDGERPFVPGDVHRVRLAPAFERSGIPRTGAGRSMLGSEPQPPADGRWSMVVAIS